MTIEGQLQYAAPLLGPMPGGMLSMVGEDGNHFVVAHATLQAYFSLSKIDTHEIDFFTLTQDEARTQLGTLGLSGVITANWYFAPHGGFVIPNTPYFFIPMFTYNYGADLSTVQIYLRYKVNSGGSVIFDGYIGGACGQSPLNNLYTLGAIGGFIIGPGTFNNIMWGVNAIGSYAYIVMDTGIGTIFAGSSKTIGLLRIPLTGNAYSDVTGSWSAYHTVLPQSWVGYLEDNPVRQYTNRVGIMEEPDGGGDVRVFLYLDNGTGTNQGFGGAACLTSRADPDTQTASASQDCSSIFGIPYADTLYNYAGSLTTDARNDYTGPTIIGTDVFFMRGFSDQLHIARRRMFSIGGADLTSIQEFDAVDDVYTTVDPSGLNGAIEFVQGFRENDIFYTMGRFNDQYVFGNMGEYPNVPPTPTGGDGVGVYYIERMDNRIWPTIDAAWCVDSGLALTQPAPSASLLVSSATGDGGIRSYNIINGGSGYTAPIGQVFDATGPGAGATVTLSVSAGVIVTATAVVIGQNYKQPAQLAILDSTGVGAVIQPLVTNYTTLSTTTTSFTASDVGSIVRVGGGKIEIVTVSTTTSAVGNVIAPITYTVPNDPYNTPVVATEGEWTMTQPTSSFTGLEHLEGLSVVALADGGVVTGLTVTNGAITLPVAVSQCVVGLPFVAQLQTMYMDLGGGPTVQTRRKDVTQVVVRVEDSRPPQVGLNQPDAATQPGQAEIPWGVRPYTGLTEIKFRGPAVPAGQPMPLYSGDLEISSVFSAWDQKGQVAIQQSDPVPLCVTGLVSWVKVGDSTGQ
jgi:hypothetical protein